MKLLSYEHHHQHPFYWTFYWHFQNMDKTRSSSAYIVGADTFPNTFKILIINTTTSRIDIIDHCHQDPWTEEEDDDMHLYLSLIMGLLEGDWRLSYLVVVYSALGDPSKSQSPGKVYCIEVSCLPPRRHLKHPYSMFFREPRKRSNGSQSIPLWILTLVKRGSRKRETGKNCWRYL
jgi:ABC-type sugar transport system permease subunit